jgi:hypothetical protein
MAHCNQCGWDWEPKVECPKACTRCKRYDWTEPKKGIKNEISNGSHDQQSGDGILSGSGERGGGGYIKNPRGTKAKVLAAVLAGTGNTKFGDVVADAANSKEHLELITAKTCKVCEGELRQMKGKWVCCHIGCGLQGVEQGKV